MLRSERALVPVKTGSQGHRVMFGTVAMEQVAEITAKERGADTAIRRIIRDAVTYIPPLSERVLEGLSPIQELLILHRTGSGEAANTFQQIEDKVHETAEKSYPTYRTFVNPAARAKDLARDITWSVHPDTEDGQIALADDNVALGEILGQSRRAAEAGDAAETQRLLLQTRPQILFGKVKTLLNSGFSFDQIAAQDPDLASDMALLEAMAYEQYGSMGSLIRPQLRKGKSIKTPEDARFVADRMKREDDLNARSMSISQIYGVFDDVRKLSDDPTITDGFKTVDAAMMRAGGIIMGLDDFFAKNGKWRQIPKFETFLEKYIVDVPDALLKVTQDILQGGDFDTSSQVLLATVSALGDAGYRYKYGIEEAANPQRQTYTAGISHLNPTSEKKLFNKNPNETIYDLHRKRRE